MATRYRLPDGILDGEIEAEEVWGGCAGGRPEYHLPDGFILLAPPGQPLERVPPPLPREPRPGHYLIGALACVCTSPGDWWVPTSAGNPGVYRYMWPTFWAKYGGPDVPIVRLVPDLDAGPIDLPWRWKEQGDRPGDTVVTADLGQVADSIRQGSTTMGIRFSPDAARAKARALWAAADAAEKEQS